MLDHTLPLLGIFLLGLMVKKFHWVQKEDGQVISLLLMNLIVPATIMNSISMAVIEPRLLLLPIAGVTVVLILLAISFLLVGLLGLRGGTKGAFLVSFPTLECGSIGYAVMSAAFGPVGLTSIALFDLGNACCFFLIIPIIASLFGQRTEQFHVASVLKQIARTPLLWAFVIGVLLNVSHIHIAVVSNLLSMIASSLLFLIMFFIGLEFECSFPSLLLPSLAMYLKMAIGISVGLMIAVLFGLTGIERIAVVLAASLPASLLTVIVAKESKLDGRFVASMLSLALPVSIAVCLIFTLIPS
ncbi:malonate transporter [Ktedonobacteria bacterium brp13]|nr:malonate transporter [Ktedonobacteria bacterium brp13]